MGQAIRVLESMVGGTTSDNVLYVTSDWRDRYHDGDVDRVLKDLAVLHQRVLQTLPELPDVFFRSDEYSTLASAYKYVLNQYMYIYI